MDGIYSPVKKSSLSEDIYERLLSLIKQDKLKPGDKLPPERELASMMGVGRPSLREALRALALVNILEIRHGDGIYITSLNPQLLFENLSLVFSLTDATFFHLFEISKILDPGIAALAAVRATDEEILELEECIRSAVEGAADTEKFLETDRELHAKITAACKNPVLTQLKMSLSGLSQASRHRTGQIPKLGEALADELRDVVAAIKARDPETAYEVMLAHMESVDTHLHVFAGEEQEG